MSYTHLRVGTKPFRSKPPRLGPPCVEPYVTGANILKDPGFELHSSLVPPGGTEDTWDFPEATLDSVATLQWNTTDITDLLYYKVNGWKVSTNNWGNSGYPSGKPVLSTANPRSGTYHWRVTWTAGNHVGGTSTWPGPVGGYYCAYSPPVAYAARVEPGDFVRYGFWAMASSTTDTPKTYLTIKFYDGAGSTCGTVQSVAEIPLTASYAWYDLSTFAPATAWAFACGGALYGDTTTADLTVDVDDAVLEVT